VGAERALKRLSLTRVRDLELGAPSSSPDRPSVSRDATLREALDAIVASTGDSVTVAGDDGAPLGVVTLEAIRAALSR
jgi:osmoprotectant transport system ATP-binding protein